LSRRTSHLCRYEGSQPRDETNRKVITPSKELSAGDNDQVPTDVVDDENKEPVDVFEEIDTLGTFLGDILYET